MSKQQMSKRHYENAARYWYFQLVVFPVMAIIGMYIVGVVIESLFFNTSGTIAPKIFAGVGGVGYFIIYFKKKIDKNV